MKDDLVARGVKLSDLAKELEEPYGNLYTALQLEASGAEVRHASVRARIEKVRGWLAQTSAAEARTEEAAAGDRTALERRVAAWPTPPGWRVSLTCATGDGREVRCGDVLTVTEEGERTRYKFLRRVDTDRSCWVDVYGGPGAKAAESYLKHRSFRPSVVGLAP